MPRSPDADAMLHAVGEGIQAFSAVEIALTQIYAAFMAPADYYLCAETLEVARHLQTKVAIVRAVGGVRLEGSNRLKTLNNLLNRVKRKGDTRHKLAHWTVGTYESGKTKKEVVRLMSPHAFSAKGWPVVTEMLTLDQIKEFTKSATVLGKDLFDFGGEIASL